MKISFECDCILLQKSLLLFCKDYVAYHKDCDFVVSDKLLHTKKPVFLINSENGNLSIPFDKKTLIKKLKNFHSSLGLKEDVKQNSNSEFEVKLERLLTNFKKDLLELLRDR